MPNKLTDAEVKKALECCIKSSHFGECFENECPCVSEKGCKVGKETLYPYVLDLINRQEKKNSNLTSDLSYAKAEVERLKEELKESLIENAELLKCKFSAEDVAQNIIRAKAKAYKEVADNIERAFSKTESQIPNIEVVEKTVQICRNAIRKVLNELVGDGD